MSVPSKATVPRSRTRGLRGSVLVAITLASVLASLGISVAVVSGIAEGVRGVGDQLSVAKPVATDPATVSESMEILTNNPFGPRYTHTSWSVREGETVILRITSYDDGTAPLTGAQTMYDHVTGTLGGTETVEGRQTSSVPNDDVAHTFTVVGLGLNLVVPAAPTGGSVTVVARFVADRSGTFVWQCYAPCGSGSNSMGGAMSTKDWMEGTVRVLS